MALMAVDTFTSILPTAYRRALERSIPNLGGRHPSLREPLLRDLDMRLVANPPRTLQIVASAAIDDPVREKIRTRVAQQTNEELEQTVLDHPELFEGAVARVPASDADWGISYIKDIIARSDTLLGLQMLTMESGRPVTDPSLDPLRTALSDARRPLWIRPAREHQGTSGSAREEALSQVRETARNIGLAHWQSHFPTLPVILHFGVAALWNLSEDDSHALRGMYLDTAGATAEQISSAARLFGADRILLSSDAPFSTTPLDMEQEALDAIRSTQLEDSQKEAILVGNWEKLRSSIPMHIQSEKDAYEQDKAQAKATERTREDADDAGDPDGAEDGEDRGEEIR